MRFCLSLLTAILLLPPLSGWAAATRPAALPDASSAHGGAYGGAHGPAFAPDEEARLDWHCLRQSYPQMRRMEADDGGLWLVLDDGRRILYQGPSTPSAPSTAEWSVDVRTSMAQPYPLEPDRPDTPPGFSPGRWRSYDLLRAVYGDSPAALRPSLRRVRLHNGSVWMADPAAAALRQVNESLAPQTAATPALAQWLKEDGGYKWRRIAGERQLSPHAFGIAIDLSAHKAAYWRWCPLRPHPLQRTYPSAIVAAFEAHGFIWGGKWHEYDLMHFEYRPEIICKARLRRHAHEHGGAGQAAGEAPAPTRAARPGGEGS